MAKKVTSVALLHTKKKKRQQPIKRSSSKRHKLKTVLKKILDYLKSDTYMFAPLVDPQTCPIITFPPAASDEVMDKQEKGFAESYLRCDFHMYALLVSNSRLDIAPEPIKDLDGSCNGVRRIAVKEIHVQHEMVKQAVRQNWLSSSPFPGKKAVSWKEPCKIVVE